VIHPEWRRTRNKILEHLSFQKKGDLVREETIEDRFQIGKTERAGVLKHLEDSGFIKSTEATFCPNDNCWDIEVGKAANDDYFCHSCERTFDGFEVVRSKCFELLQVPPEAPPIVVEKQNIRNADAPVSVMFSGNTFVGNPQIVSSARIDESSISTSATNSWAPSSPTGWIGILVGVGAAIAFLANLSTILQCASALMK